MDVYKNYLSKIRSIGIFLETKHNLRYKDNFNIFYIRGTRISLKLERYYSASGSSFIGTKEYVQKRWYVKTKNKKEYNEVSFQEILESDKISKDVMEKLLFNIDLFV